MSVSGCGGRVADKLGRSELYPPSPLPLPPPKGAEGSAGVGEGEMTSPIRMMEWLGYSWLHTGVFSHSHSPPVQRRRHNAFQTLICLICLFCNILPSESIKKKIQTTTRLKYDQKCFFMFSFEYLPGLRSTCTLLHFHRLKHS